MNSEAVGLGGDGDEVELIEAFEAAFDISFSYAEAEEILTLGQAFEAICSKLPEASQQQKKCLTAMVYFRLNRALTSEGKLCPATRIEVPGSRSPKSFQAKLENSSRLNLDFLTGQKMSTVFLFCFQFVSWVAAPVLLSGNTALVAAVAIAGTSHLLWRNADRMDNSIWIFDGTLGELSQRAAETNFGHLVSSGATWSRSDVWKAMTSIIQDFTGFPVENMNSETKFI